MRHTSCWSLRVRILAHLCLWSRKMCLLCPIPKGFESIEQRLLLLLLLTILQVVCLSISLWYSTSQNCAFNAINKATEVANRFHGFRHSTRLSVWPWPMNNHRRSDHLASERPFPIETEQFIAYFANAVNRKQSIFIFLCRISVISDTGQGPCRVILHFFGLREKMTNQDSLC